MKMVSGNEYASAMKKAFELYVDYKYNGKLDLEFLFDSIDDDFVVQIIDIGELCIEQREDKEDYVTLCKGYRKDVLERYERNMLEKINPRDLDITIEFNENRLEFPLILRRYAYRTIKHDEPDSIHRIEVFGCASVQDETVRSKSPSTLIHPMGMMITTYPYHDYNEADWPSENMENEYYLTGLGVKVLDFYESIDREEDTDDGGEDDDI